MDCTFEEYIEDVKSQLWCNASDEYRSTYITYDYSDKDIDISIEHFKNYWQKNISGYKALLDLGYYLLEQNIPLEDTTTR